MVPDAHRFSFTFALYLFLISIVIFLYSLLGEIHLLLRNTFLWYWSYLMNLVYDEKYTAEEPATILTWMRAEKTQISIVKTFFLFYPYYILYYYYYILYTGKTRKRLLVLMNIMGMNTTCYQRSVWPKDFNLSHAV